MLIIRDPVTLIVRRERSQASVLTDTKIRQAKPQAVQYKLYDGGGLHLREEFITD